MAPSWPADVAGLARLPNLVITAAGVAVGGFLAMGNVAWPHQLWWAMGSAVLLATCGNIANDLTDVDADRINRPWRALPSGKVRPGTARLLGGAAGGFGLAMAWVGGRELFALAFAALAVMLVYSPLLKPFGLAGNLAVALVASLPVLYGAAAVGWIRAGLVPAAIAAILHFAREIVKDLEDVAGDRVAGRRTVPLRHGAAAGFVVAAIALVLFVPASLAPWFAGWYGRRYGLGIVALDLGVAVVIARLLAHRLGGASLALKGAMVAGLAALLWDRL